MCLFSLFILYWIVYIANTRYTITSLEKEKKYENGLFDDGDQQQSR